MRNNAIFVTGTDTDTGKTFVSSLIIQQLNAMGWQTFGMKPIASGCHFNANRGLENEDALTLQAVASIKTPYNVVNPIALEQPIAPHLAAKAMGFGLTSNGVQQCIERSMQHQADLNVIEGVGGWSVPINERELLSNVVEALAMPVVLVIGIRLGCLNHAILTDHAIRQTNCPLLGWVANCLEPEMLSVADNVKTLKQWMHSPLLGVVHYNEPGLPLDLTAIQALIN